MSLLRIQNLTYRHPEGSDCLRDIDLVVEEGEFIIIAGRNGSGKTTLCKHFNGLLQPEEGSVLLHGVPIREDIRRARQTVGMVFQNADSQIVGETVSADIAFGPENLRLGREEIDRRVEQALHIVGLEPLRDHSPHILSGGEKRRLAIAGVLAMQPRIIVLDEPFASLDYPGSLQILDRILRLWRDNRTIVVVSHDLELVAAHAGRIIVMEKGKIVRDGKPKEVLPDIEQFGIRPPHCVRYGKETATWPN